MTTTVEVNGKDVCVVVSENNGEYQPMTMFMSYHKLTKEEENTARGKALKIYYA